jgi:hypothetical protein
MSDDAKARGWADLGEAVRHLAGDVWGDHWARRPSDLVEDAAEAHVLASRVVWAAGSVGDERLLAAAEDVRDAARRLTWYAMGGCP